MVVYQLLLLAIIVPISFGPLARVGLNHAVPDFFLIVVWLFAWLTDRATALRWAVLSGLIVDALNFHLFGLWLVTYCVIVFVIDYLKNRYFDVLSLVQALVCLVGANVIVLVVDYISGGNFIWRSALFSVIYNVVIAMFLYYLLATRFNLFARWRGKNI